MRVIETELDDLLNLIESHIDLNHCRQVDERYRNVLSWGEVDQPPLVVQGAFGTTIKLPPPWERFRRYDYRETFESPVAMLQNMLLERVLPGVLLKDDNPLAIRNNHGTIQVASALKAKWDMHKDNYPWVTHFDSLGPIREIAAGKSVDLRAGVLSRSIETLKFYHEELARYPACKEAIQISMPDLQGPVDTAEQLWGSDIYYAFADEADLLQQLLSRIVTAMLAMADEFRKYARDRLAPAATTQHGYMIPGRLMIRNDSSIMLSPEMYDTFVRPHDSKVLHEVGCGSIHFCGNGQHLIEKMLDIPDLKGIDLGQPELMDVPTFYAMCRERNVAVTNLKPSRDALMSGEAVREFPTGCVFVYLTDDIEDAKEVVRAYHS